MKSQFFPFLAAADRAITASDCRGRIIGTAVALAAARLAALPSAPVDSVSTHYNFSVLQSVESLIAAFNEQVVFDARHALKQAREFWFLRYEGLHPSGFPIFNCEVGFYDNILGVPRWVDDDSHKFNNEHKVSILALTQLAHDLIIQKERDLTYV